MKEFEDEENFHEDNMDDDIDDDDDDDGEEIYYRMMGQEALDAAHISLTEYNLNIELLKLLFVNVQNLDDQKVAKLITYYRLFYKALNNDNLKDEMGEQDA